MARWVKQFGAGFLGAGIVVAALLGVAAAAGFGRGPGDSRAAAEGATEARHTSPAPQAGDVAAGFSILHDPTAAPAPPTIVARLREMHSGPYSEAKTARDGMYLAENHGALCAYITNGMAGCTDRLDPPDAWIGGEMMREFDSEFAPFKVHLCGFARDTVAAFRVRTSDGVTHLAPVASNAFDITLRDTTYDDIVAMDEVYRSGRILQLDPRSYFPTRQELERFSHY
jgi:hypothetical protein